MILKEAKRCRADLVVVGTHNKQGLKKFLFGSESEKLIHKITIPILLIHSKKQ
jgi:nucleotide-binding universal stress UspA family protein